MIEVTVESALRIADARLLLDGRDEERFPIPGPPSAGVYGEAASRPRAVLATPGRHTVELQALVWLPIDEAGFMRSVSHAVAQEVELARGQRLSLGVVVDAHGARLVS